MTRNYAMNDLKRLDKFSPETLLKRWINAETNALEFRELCWNLLKYPFIIEHRAIMWLLTIIYIVVKFNLPSCGVFFNTQIFPVSHKYWWHQGILLTWHLHGWHYLNSLWLVWILWLVINGNSGIQPRNISSNIIFYLYWEACL